MRIFGLFALAGLGLARDKYLQRFTVQVKDGKNEALRIGKVIYNQKYLIENLFFLDLVVVLRANTKLYLLIVASTIVAITSIVAIT